MTKIMLDMDGVIANFSDSTRLWIMGNGETKLGLTPDQIEHIKFHPATAWSMYRIDWGIPFSTFDKAVRLATKEQYWVTMPPIGEAIETVKNMVDNGHEIHIVTNPWGKDDETGRDDCFRDASVQKLAWIAHQKIPASTVRFGHRHKVDEDLDICIEDRIENVVGFAATGRPAICHARPWNDLIDHADQWDEALAGRDLHSLITRATWPQMEEAVEWAIARI